MNSAAARPAADADAGLAPEDVDLIGIDDVDDIPIDGAEEGATGTGGETAGLPRDCADDDDDVGGGSAS
eukprot:CAMPEP_0183293340 /NCGR_PEP_ID=MMETSP0160_2-20130417/2059_1 /TAXON_ID=2839 ORGANISM="Odontella Sinensis, Strain Grunow 1884" /NCGR_SAMPLE_ID=MMETSP0160_2 /ASSEMBLY_ACC=CAM_ASM_000250 /LENGTH=68 /DNA_ID=CAMNT_0025454439 /DNA_START=35 /DNA_END=238 /DNA_ORIENTATION=+